MGRAKKSRVSRAGKGPRKSFDESLRHTRELHLRMAPEAAERIRDLARASGLTISGYLISILPPVDP